MKKTTYFLLTLLAMALLVSCSGNDGYPIKVKYLAVKLQGSEKWSILDVESGEVVARDAWDSVAVGVNDDLVGVHRPDGLLDFYRVNDTAHAVTSRPLGSVTAFGGGRAMVSRPGSTLMIIDDDGEPVAALEASINSAMGFSHGLSLATTLQGKHIYIKENGDTLDTGLLDFAAPFAFDEAALVVRDASVSTPTITAIDTDGKELFSVSAKDYRLTLQPLFAGGVVPMVKVSNDSLVYLDKSGKEVANPNEVPQVVRDAGYDYCRRTLGGLNVVRTGDRCGVANDKGELVVPAKYEEIVDIAPERFVVKEGGVYHLVNAKGEKVGDAVFVDFLLPDMQQPAVRGFIDQALATATLMMCFDENMAGGVRRGGTLMDLNSHLGPNAVQYVGQNELVERNGALTMTYHFDNDIASEPQQGGDTLALPQFNYDARVMAVSLVLDVPQTEADTEPGLERLVSSRLGQNGFVYDTDGIYKSESGTAVALGYNRGSFIIYYYMDSSYAQPLPHNKRNLGQ